MINISDLRNLPKADLHNHLGAGMRYASFIAWAGYEIPDFPPVQSRPEKLFSEVIGPFIKSRNASTKDTASILQLAINDAIADNVKVLKGSIDSAMMELCDSAMSFTNLILQIKEKVSEKVSFLPDIEFGPAENTLLLQEKALPLLSSGAFSGVCAYGPACSALTDTFKAVYKIADNLRLNRKCMANANMSADAIVKMIDAYNLNEVQCGINIAKDSDALKFVAERKVRFNMCPASDVYYGTVPSYEEHPIRKMLDAGVDVTIGTNCLLVFNKSISEQCKSFIDDGIFSVDEIKTLLEKSTK